MIKACQTCWYIGNEYRCECLASDRYLFYVGMWSDNYSACEHFEWLDPDMEYIPRTPRMLMIV